MTETAFDRAVNIARDLPSVPTEAQLRLYGLYKISMCGDQAASSATPPSLLDLRGRKKWAAWGDISDELSQTTEGHKKASVAKEMYVELVSTLAGNTVTVTFNP